MAELASSLRAVQKGAEVERLGTVSCGCCLYVFTGNITPVRGGLFHADVQQVEPKLSTLNKGVSMRMASLGQTPWKCFPFTGTWGR